MAKSIIQTTKECYVCKSINNLETHHIFFGTANRKKSEQDGLKVYLCVRHHRVYKTSVHGGNKALDTQLKQMAQRIYMKKNNKTIQDFRNRYGKNYLDEIE